MEGFNISEDKVKFVLTIKEAKKLFHELSTRLDSRDIEDNVMLRDIYETLEFCLQDLK